MTALGAITTRTRLAWAMLNLSFRKPAVLAKMLATLDQITHGRVICSAGAGWFKDEYAGYDLPFQEEHDDRLSYAREALLLMRELWTHPAPERVTFEGRFLKTQGLAFNPLPYQRPHPPIWFGGTQRRRRRWSRSLPMAGSCSEHPRPRSRRRSQVPIGRGGR